MGILRFILALCVVIQHSNWKGPSPLPGYDAVHMFFVISGFYMAMVLRQKYGFTQAGIGRFWANRFLRLYPTYLAAVLATVGWSLTCHWYSRGVAPQFPLAANVEQAAPIATVSVWITTFTLVGVDLPNWFCHSVGSGFYFAPPSSPPAMPANWLGNLPVLPQAWTIGAEICFYMLAPFAAGGKGLKAFLMGVVSFLLLGMGLPLLHGGYFIWPFWLWIFCAGILSYLSYERLRGRSFPPAVSKYSLMLVVGVLTTVVIVLPMIGNPLQKIPLILATACAVPVLFSATKNSKIDRHIGNLSYPIYVIHLLADKQSQFAIGHLGISFSWLPVFTIVWSVVLAVALVYLLEEPIEKVRRKIARGKRPTSPLFEVAVVKS